MSNGNSGYGGYNSYFYPTQHPQQRVPDKHNTSTPIQLAGVSIGGGRSVGGIAGGTSEYNSRPQSQHDYFGAVQQQSWGGQSAGQPTTQQSHGDVGYGAAQASKLGALGDVGGGRVGSSLGVGSTPSNTMSSAASVNSSYQQLQHQQSQYPASTQTQKPVVTSQYYGQQQDTGRIVTTNPSANHAILQPTATPMQNTQSSYGHNYQSGLHFPNSGQTNSSCNQNEEQALVERRQAQALEVVPVAREYQAATHFSTSEPTQASAHNQEQVQLQRRQAMHTHNNVQSQAQRSGYNDYQTMQKVQNQQYKQAVSTVQSHTPTYYQQNEQSLNTSNSRVQGQSPSFASDYALSKPRQTYFHPAVSQTSSPPANTYPASTSTNHAYVDQTPNTYNAQNVTTTSSVKATYNPAQAESSDGYSTAYSAPVQRTPTLYANTESLPSSTSYTASQPPVRIQTSPQPVSKLSPRLQQQQAHSQSQAHTQAIIQAQAAKAQAEAQVQARIQAQAQAAKAQAEAQAEAEAQAKTQAEALAKQHAEALAKQRAEALAKQRTEALAKQHAEALARQQEEALAKQQEEALAKRQEEALARQQEEYLAKQQAEKARTEAEAAKPQAEVDALALALAQAKAKQTQAKVRLRAKAREKAQLEAQVAEEQARQEAQKQAQQQVEQQARGEVEKVAKEQQQIQYSSVTPAQTHSPPDQTDTPLQQQQQQPPIQSTISPPDGNASVVVGLPGTINYAEMERHMREMVERMRQYQSIDPTGFHAVWENVKKGGGLGATPEPRDVSRETPSNAHTPHTKNQQTPRPVTNAPHQNAQAHLHSSSAALSPPDGPVHQTLPHAAGMGYGLGDQGVKAPSSLPQVHRGMPLNTVSPQKPSDFTGGPIQAHLSDPSNYNRSAPQTTLHSSHGTQSVPHAHAQSQSGLSPSSHSRETPLFPPDRRPMLATKATIFMANNGCNNPPLPEDWVRTLLNGNPSPNFVRLCETLESAGYIFDRPDFARALVSDVPPSISDRDSGVDATNGDHRIASLNDRPAVSSGGNTKTGSVHDKSTDIQHSTQAQQIQKRPRGRPKKTATSEATTNSKGKYTAIIQTKNLPEASVQSTSENIQSPELKDGTATDAPAQPTAHDGPNSSPAKSPRYPPPIRKGPAPQSVEDSSPEVQSQPQQPDKQFVSPHLLWHDQPSHHPLFQSQPQFFNDDISYVQDSHDSDAGAPQWVTHKIPQSTQLSEATSNRLSNVEVTNHSSHPKAQAPTSQHLVPTLYVEQHEYFHNQVAHPPSATPVAQMAPVAPMVGIEPLPVEQPIPPAHQAPVNPPVLDTAPQREAVPDITKLPPVLMLLGKEKIVKKISKRKAARVSTYDPKTIARNVLLATGRHPNMAPLNSHLFPLLNTLSSYMDKDSDLETLRWDLIDPIPEGAKIVELPDDDDDLVVGDLEPVATAQSPKMDLTPSPQPKPRSRHRWKKPGEEDKGSESKQEKSKGRRKGRMGDTHTTAAPAPSNPPRASSTGPKPRVPRPRASLGGLSNSAIAAHSTIDKDRRATMSGALATNRSTEKNAGGVEKKASVSPRPRLKGPRMRLVGPPATPRSKPEEVSPKASAWTPVNNVETSTQPRSKLAAVVIQSRTPSAAEPDENSAQANKRKNADTEDSVRPRKRALIIAVGNRSSSPPMFDAVKCRWKDCRAQLHTVGLLRKHTTKVHKHKASFGGYPCYWKGCSRPMALGKKVKGPVGMMEKARQYLDFDTENEWEEHIESAHLSELAQLEEADDGHGSDMVGADLPQPSSVVKGNHITLPPPPSQPQDQPPVKRGPRFKSMLGRRNSGITGIRTPATPKEVVEVVERSPSASGSGKKPTSASRTRVTKAAPLSTVHVLSDDD